MHEKLMSAVLTRAVAQLSFPNPMIRINLGLGIAGKEQAGTVNGRSEVAHQGVTEIFRRNTTTGSVRQTVEIFELRARDNATRVGGKIYYRDILATGSMSIYLSHLPMANSSTETL